MGVALGSQVFSFEAAGVSMLFHRAMAAYVWAMAEGWKQSAALS